MDSEELERQVEAARSYEALHVPALFGQWAEPVLDAAGVREGDRLLDVACGTGALARAAAERVGGNGVVAGLDAGPGMLEVAQRISPDIDWRHGMAERLPWPDRSFDVVCSQFGLMFFEDRPAALQEMRRLLEPGGRIAIAVWDSLENCSAYADTVALLDHHAGPEAAAALRAPFTLGDPAPLRELTREAAFENVQVQPLPGLARFPSVRVMIEAELYGWLPLMGVELAENQCELILTEAEKVLAKYVLEDGRVEFDISALLTTALRT